MINCTKFYLNNVNEEAPETKTAQVMKFLKKDIKLFLIILIEYSSGI